MQQLIQWTRRQSPIAKKIYWCLNVPYHPQWNEIAKELGIEYSPQKVRVRDYDYQLVPLETWWVTETQRDAVQRALLELYGTTGQEPCVSHLRVEVRNGTYTSLNFGCGDLATVKNKRHLQFHPNVLILRGKVSVHNGIVRFKNCILQIHNLQYSCTQRINKSPSIITKRTEIKSFKKKFTRVRLPYILDAIQRCFVASVVNQLVRIGACDVVLQT